MKKIEIGKRKIYQMKDGNILLELDGKVYLLDDNLWIDDAGNIYRKLSRIDSAMLQELI